MRAMDRKRREREREQQAELEGALLDLDLSPLDLDVELQPVRDLRNGVDGESKQRSSNNHNNDSNGGPDQQHECSGTANNSLSVADAGMTPGLYQSFEGVIRVAQLMLLRSIAAFTVRIDGGCSISYSSAYPEFRRENPASSVVAYSNADTATTTARFEQITGGYMLHRGAFHGASVLIVPLASHVFGFTPPAYDGINITLLSIRDSLVNVTGAANVRSVVLSHFHNNNAHLNVQKLGTVLIEQGSSLTVDGLYLVNGTVSKDASIFAVLVNIDSGSRLAAIDSVTTVKITRASITISNINCTLSLRAISSPATYFAAWSTIQVDSFNAVIHNIFVADELPGDSSSISSGITVDTGGDDVASLNGFTPGALSPRTHTTTVTSSSIAVTDLYHVGSVSLFGVAHVAGGMNGTYLRNVHLSSRHRFVGDGTNVRLFEIRRSGLDPPPLDVNLAIEDSSARVTVLANERGLSEKEVQMAAVNFVGDFGVFSPNCAKRGAFSITVLRGLFVVDGDGIVRSLEASVTRGVNPGPRISVIDTTVQLGSSTSSGMNLLRTTMSSSNNYSTRILSIRESTCNFENVTLAGNKLNYFLDRTAAPSTTALIAISDNTDLGGNFSLIDNIIAPSWPTAAIVVISTPADSGFGTPFSIVLNGNVAFNDPTRTNSGDYSIVGESSPDAFLDRSSTVDLNGGVWIIRCNPWPVSFDDRFRQQYGIGIKCKKTFSNTPTHNDTITKSTSKPRTLTRTVSRTNISSETASVSETNSPLHISDTASHRATESDPLSASPTLIVPPIPKLKLDTPEAARGLLALAGILGGATGSNGYSMSYRVASLVRVGDCEGAEPEPEPLEIDSNPTFLTIGSEDDDLRTYYGAIVGNLSLVFGAFVVFAVWCFVFARWQGVSLRDGALNARAPGIVGPLVCTVAPPTVAAAATIVGVGRGPLTAAQVVLCVVAFAMFGLAPLIVLAKCGWQCFHHETLIPNPDFMESLCDDTKNSNNNKKSSKKTSSSSKKKEKDKKKDKKNQKKDMKTSNSNSKNPSIHTLIPVLYGYAVDSWVMWKESDFTQRYGLLFDPYGKAWFGVVDFAFTTIISTVGGSASVCRTDSCCRASVIICLVSSIIHASLLMYFRPYIARFENFIGFVGITLTVTCSALAVVTHFEGDDESTTTVAVRLGELALALGLINGVKGLLDMALSVPDWLKTQLEARQQRRDELEQQLLADEKEQRRQQRRQEKLEERRELRRQQRTHNCSNSNSRPQNDDGNEEEMTTLTFAAINEINRKAQLEQRQRATEILRERRRRLEQLIEDQRLEHERSYNDFWPLSSYSNNEQP